MTRADQTDSVNNPCVNCRCNIAPRVSDHVDSRLAHAKTCPLDRNFYQVAPVFVRIITIPADRKISPDIDVPQLQPSQRFVIACYESEGNVPIFQLIKYLLDSRQQLDRSEEHTSELQSQSN